MSIKIQKLEIKRFRSLFDFKVDIDTNNNFISICGENNTGKTNLLRAINLFFNPALYDRTQDAPHHKLSGSGGGATYPIIKLHFLNTETSDTYWIEKKFNAYDISEERASKNGEDYSIEDAKRLLEKIKIFYIESINIDLPKTINQVIQEVYEEKYSRARLSGAKKNIKEKFTEYQEALSEVLNELANEITESFQKFNSDWRIEFQFKSNIIRFIDLISDDITVFINDGSNPTTSGKGSGLQRLSHILLIYKIIKEMSDNSVILLVDEPDVYLHASLQRKLKELLQEVAVSSQVFLTTHSPIFIDTYSLKNVFLLDVEKEPVTYQRSPNKEFTKISTKSITFTNVDGANKIRTYLGLENIASQDLQECNWIVEGSSDKIYLEGLCKLFSLPVPNIVIATGASQISKQANHYNSLYNEQSFKPKIYVLFDNDPEGRQHFQSFKEESFNNLSIKKKLVPNFKGQILPDKPKIPNIPNNEIEDFLYPKLFAYCVNKFLERKGFNLIDADNLETKINGLSFIEKGIIELVDSLKDEANLEEGQNCRFSWENVKNGVARIFEITIEANLEISGILEEENLKYPCVYQFLQDISSFRDFE
jgi:predicted ATP-dependent endonuclease of OLD family